MDIRRAIASVLLISGSCATTPRQAPPPPSHFDPRSLADAAATPAECEVLAREERASSPEHGWNTFVACVRRGAFPRQSFTDLRLILQRPWRDDLIRRSEGPEVVARVVALRGGDIDGDLAEVAAKGGPPLATLADALREPARASEQPLLVRGVFVRWQEAPVPGAALFIETTVRPDRIERASSEADQLHPRLPRLDGETGRYGIASVGAAERLPDRSAELLVLARFQGVRPGPHNVPLAVLTILGRYPIGKSLVF